MKFGWIGLVVAFLIVSCVYHDMPEEVIPVVIDCSTLSLEVTDSTKATVCGAEDGSITVEATGGTPPYFFSLNGGPEQESPIFSNLPSDLYSIVVYDSNRCNVQRDNILITVFQFGTSVVAQPDFECLTDDGSIEVTVLENSHPYKFNLDENGFTPDSVFENLKNGDHFLVIQDKDGCNVQVKVVVPRGSTQVSWANDILPIMTQSCAISGCHNGVSRPNDWRQYSQAKQYAATIKKKTLDKSMPFNGPLPQDKIDLIACWVDDGAPEN